MITQERVIKEKRVYPRDTLVHNKDICTTMFIAALFIIARAGKNPDVLQKMNGYKNCGTFTQWSTT